MPNSTYVYPTDQNISIQIFFSITVQRPEEVTAFHNKSASIASIIEGQTEFAEKFVDALETEIILDRKFTKPGYVYNLTLLSLNLHDVTSPNIIMKWHILCQNPVKPQDWELEYESHLYYGK